MVTTTGDRPGDERWDFFISYASADRDWAEWIAWELEEAGYQVLVQVWDFVPGSHWMTSMAEGIERSRRTLAVLSHSYLSSMFGRKEWEAAYRADPNGFNRKLVPVRVEDCPRPALLDAVVSFDLFGLELDAARSQLLDNIRVALAGRAKPLVPPPFPTARPTPTTADFPWPAVPREAGHGSAPPFPRGAGGTPHGLSGRQSPSFNRSSAWPDGFGRAASGAALARTASVTAADAAVGSQPAGGTQPAEDRDEPLSWASAIRMALIAAALTGCLPAVAVVVFLLFPPDSPAPFLGRMWDGGFLGLILGAGIGSGTFALRSRSTDPVRFIVASLFPVIPAGVAAGLATSFAAGAGSGAGVGVGAFLGAAIGRAIMFYDEYDINETYDDNHPVLALGHASGVSGFVTATFAGSVAGLVGGLAEGLTAHLGAVQDVVYGSGVAFAVEEDLVGAFDGRPVRCG
ncbi:MULTISPECIES: toll/interleukin-1 receptor domain-containing protein [unclassified Pseudofrankia]|uniref:toll/interleukin-1 receptor domain-containing protein n=2 Tax=Pseudofrankia TaxID=2994363 RepID=UPI001F52AD44|nr:MULTISPECIES: toll/interleukin-1 receptor domain-containing protein [unclassified Pseudofrankia]MDT3445434.1 TIR domain-containing protein [Pseudofrankia sp. BMG5.37]